MKLKKTTYIVNTFGAAPDRLAGRKIALLADFHNGDPDPILEMLREDVPDAILIPGDVVLGYFPEGDDLIIDRCRNVITFLEGCAAIAPAYLSIGNHECLLCDEDYDAIRATGTIVLDNEWTELSFSNDQNDRILIGGLTSAYAISYRRFRNEVNIGRSEEDYVRYPYRRRPKDIRKRPTDSMWLDDFINEKGYKILLSHHPEYWCMREPMLSRRKIDLVVSGHAHGGQWAVSGRGVYAPGQGLLPKYTRGIHYGPYGRMIVSRGMTNPYDFAPRWGSPCEAIYIEFE